MDVDGLRQALLDARDERADLLRFLQSALTGRSEQDVPGSTIFLSLNVPGPDKTAASLHRTYGLARTTVLRELPGARLLLEGGDPLGFFALLETSAAPVDAKRLCVRLEESLPFGRLLDVDVIGLDGFQVDRAFLGLAARRCLVCPEPAVDCMRAGRHTLAQLTAAVERLSREPLVALARALVNGARHELGLTPKPGLVDRADNGSHPDLSFELMSRAIDELPRYYEELIGLSETGDVNLAACAAAGLRAESRMSAAARSNTHRGYIFLSGLLLLGAAADVTGTEAGWRERVAAIAGRLAERAPASSAEETGRRPSADRGSGRETEGTGRADTHGEQVRRRHGVRGIYGEALDGLPSVFDHGLPALRRGLAAFGSRETAQHYLMAVLMTKVEDTTALHRCGPPGLARLRADGAALKALMEKGGDHLSRLRSLNDEYRAMRLTMGGVADCLALTVAVAEAGGA